MTPKQREELKQAALAADQGGQHIYTNPRDSNNWSNNETWHAAASPAVVLSLIAQVEALTVPQWISVETAPENDTAVIVLFWPYGNKENTQIAQSARYFDGSFIDEDGNEMHPPSHWMPFVFPTIPAIPGTKEGA